MARKRRLQSDSEDEQDDVETQDDLESSRPKKKRVSSAKGDSDTEKMEEGEFDCSQFPDFPVSTVSYCVWGRGVAMCLVELTAC